MQPGRIIGGIFLSILFILPHGGCARVQSVLARSGDKVYAVKTESADFYRYSPRQGSGPDRTIPKDTAMKVIRLSFAYCKVQLLSGETGYVANDDIAPAPPRLLAAGNPPPQPPSPASAWHAEIPEPRTVAPEAPLPEFEPTPLPLPPNLSN